MKNYFLLIFLVFVGCTKCYYKQTQLQINKIEQQLTAPEKEYKPLKINKNHKKKRTGTISHINKQLNQLVSELNQLSEEKSQISYDLSYDTLCFKNIIPHIQQSGKNKINFQSAYQTFFLDSIRLDTSNQLSQSHKIEAKEKTGMKAGKEDTSVVSLMNMSRLLLLERIIDKKHTVKMTQIKEKQNILLLKFYSIKNTYEKITPRRWLRRIDLTHECHSDIKK